MGMCAWETFTVAYIPWRIRYPPSMASFPISNCCVMSVILTLFMKLRYFLARTEID